VTEVNSNGDTLYWVLNFYAPWCTHCVQAIPKYKRVAEIFDGEVEFGAVNCEVRCSAAQCMLATAWANGPLRSCQMVLDSVPGLCVFLS
jgi:thiol-disulfide isomerase/thioredoxin